MSDWPSRRGQYALVVLRRARARIATADKWVQGAFAVNAEGKKVCETQPDAVRFCMLGALNADYNTLPYERACARVELEAAVGNIVNFNDDPETTHSDILATFDRTIARLESEAQQ